MKSKILVSLLAFALMVPAVTAQPEVRLGGLIYIYSFLWQNADFDNDTKDGDQFFYLHGDLSATADFGKGVTAKVKVGDWGSFGMHSVTHEGSDGLSDTPYDPMDDIGVHIMEAHITAANLGGSPVGIRLGKEHVRYGEGMVAFDGGEDGFMGGKLFYDSPMFDLDLFWYRLTEGGGLNYIGYRDTTIPVAMRLVPDDLDLYGVYATVKLMEGQVGVSPYWFYRTQGYGQHEDSTYSNNPMWLGGRIEGMIDQSVGLGFRGEFAMMSGKKEYHPAVMMVDTADYKGMAFMGAVDWSLAGIVNFPVTVGGAYVSFSGDDTTTVDECEDYESATNGPFLFGYYKGWPGFGPGHTLLTGYGFSLLAPASIDRTCMCTNINVINGYLQYAHGPVAIRGDYFMYSRNWVPEGDEDALGSEVAAHVAYNYEDALTIGLAGGYFMPGDYFGDDPDPMFGGYLYMAKGF